MDFVPLGVDLSLINVDASKVEGLLDILGLLLMLFVLQSLSMEVVRGDGFNDSLPLLRTA